MVIQHTDREKGLSDRIGLLNKTRSTKGPKGDKGLPGDKGIKGDKGEDGIFGIKGKFLFSTSYEINGA
jgi:hypothetical protein